MKRLFTWVAMAIVVGVCLGWGCGQRIDAPEEGEPPKFLPEPDSYVQIYVRFGFDSTTDVELAGGGLLYVASEEGVSPYYQPLLTGPGFQFDDLVEPAVVAEAPDGTILVGDQGDMHVKVFNPDGGSPTVRFTDSDWIRFGGLAADDSGNIFVADVEKSFVRSYLPDGTPRFEADLADSGFGLGHVIQPHGLFYDGAHLWIADTGKNWIQKVEPDSVQLGYNFLDGYTFQDAEGNETKLPFSSPVDVALDSDGFLYVADRGNRRVFKFNQTGNEILSFATVNYDTTAAQPPRLRSIGVNTSRVYAVDDSLGAILVWQPN